MAGYRRRAARQSGVDIQPLQRTLREQRRLAALQERLADAVTPADRIGAAAAYVRSVIAYAAPDTAESLADDLVRHMTRAGAEVFASRPRSPRRRSSRRSS